MISTRKRQPRSWLCLAGFAFLGLQVTFAANDAPGLLDTQIPTGNNEANLLYQDQQYQQALDKYLELYEKEPENSALAYNIANTYAAMGDTEKAGEFYQKAIEGEHVEAKSRSEFNMGNLQLESGKLEEAIRNYADYLRANPEDIDAKRNLEIALRRLQRMQQQQQKQPQKQKNEDKENKQENQQPQNMPNMEQNEQDQEQEQKQKEQQQQQEMDSDAKQGKEQGDEEDKLPKESKELKDAEQEDAKERKPEKDKKEEERRKEQIFETLADQEQEQQKEYQKRKMGKSPTKAKDW
ncbi:Tetratricopeptide repeat protein [Sulfidibacter corallicola]|uniref:Tetratricopeptide repeat protein n=1 Tax=Sulfidibacter corallicola TaxID=2818388 RepID=A0A8A4TQ29_SULCO|nr:tetratricopeptide repeat protein [Sulfidibacter corallicola]QTD51021.1 tetratricopeptide repeat protein [Sulfidibacter corallicola]